MAWISKCISKNPKQNYLSITLSFKYCFFASFPLFQWVIFLLLFSINSLTLSHCPTNQHGARTLWKMEEDEKRLWTRCKVLKWSRRCRSLCSSWLNFLTIYLFIWLLVKDACFISPKRNMMAQDIATELNLKPHMQIFWCPQIAPNPILLW